MSITSEISRIQSAKNTLKTKLNSKNDAQHQISTETIDEYGDFVDSIPTGTDTSDATATASNILTGKTAYISTGKVNGSMTNNGTLSYTPSSSTQIIPAGYTSGGTISPMDITESDDYNTCLGLSEQIMGGTPYTELTYIQSTGTQYIDTGIVPSNHYVEVKAQFTQNESNKVLFGYNSNDFHITWYDNKWYYANNGSEQNGGSSYLCTNINTFVYGANTPFTINNNIINSNCNATSNGNLWILRRPGNQAAQPAKAKIYYFKIYNKSTNTLVRNFIPVKDPNNVVCLYDKVSNDYFYNEGSGTFIAGGEV